MVGTGNKISKFNIHKDVLCSASPFFAAACKPEWMSADDREIKLPDDDPETIQAMVYWIYYDRICILESIDERRFDYGTTTEAAMMTRWGLVAKLYVCGDKYQMPSLQNDAVDAMIDHAEDTGEFRCPAIIPWVYENTPSEARIRGLLVLFVKCGYTCSEMTISKQYLCSEFLYDLSFSFFGTVDRVDSDGFGLFPDHCLRFHNHAGDGSADSFRPCKVLKHLEYYDSQTDDWDA